MVIFSKKENGFREEIAQKGHFRMETNYKQDSGVKVKNRKKTCKLFNEYRHILFL